MGLSMRNTSQTRPTKIRLILIKEKREKIDGIDSHLEKLSFILKKAPPYPYPPPNQQGMSAPPYAGAGYNPGYPVPQSEPFIPENPEHNHDPSHLPHDAELPSYEWATSTY